MQVQPYLNFDGRCEEAINFYKDTLDAEVACMMRFKDSPEKQPGTCPPGAEDKIMHSTLRIGGSTIMASDCHAQGRPNFQGFSLSLTARDDAHAKRLFDRLADGGKVTMPLTKTFFSSSFGVLTDRFGLSWMIVVEQ
jgi:PhnB protein